MTHEVSANRGVSADDERATNEPTTAPPITRPGRSRPVPSPNPGGSNYRPDIQGLRALAVVMVVVYHLFPGHLVGGFVGVDVFFVVSGFLITGHLARTMKRTGRVSLIDFYARRARRLMPAAILVLVVTWIGSRVALPSTQLPATAEQVRASALYFQNWLLAHDAVNYLTADQAASPVQHFWSLSVEEQFYLVWPLLFLIAAGCVRAFARLRRPARGSAPWRTGAAGGVILALALAVFVSSLVYSVVETSSNPAAAYFITPTRMWELALGGLVALLPAWLDRARSLGVLAWAGLAMILWSGFTFSATMPFPGSAALVPTVGAALFIVCGSRPGRFCPNRIASSKPMVFLGDISYSLYLWHWPLIVLYSRYVGGRIGFVDRAVVAAVAVLLAWLTTVLVENRIRRAVFFAEHRWRALSLAVGVGVPAVLVSVFLAGQPGPYVAHQDAAHPGSGVLAGAVTSVPYAAPMPPVIDARADGNAYIAGPRGCQTPQLSTVPAQCTYGDTQHPTKTVALVGDSVAGQWFAAIESVAIEQHWRLVLDLHSECPFTATLLNYPTDNSPYTACRTWGQTVLHDLLTRIKPAFIITSARPAIGTAAHHTADRIAHQQIADGMETYWKQLRAHGIPVIALDESPEMGRNIPDCLAAHGGTVDSCSTPVSRAIRAGLPLATAVAALPGDAHLVDMNPLICAPTVCRPIVGNVVVYRDSHHLTKTYVMTMTPYLRTRLLAAVAANR